MMTSYMKGAISAALLTAAMLGAEPVWAADEEVTLSVSLFTPPSSDLNKSFRSIQEALNEETGGRITFEMYEASQMGPAPRQYDMVRKGVADITVALLGLTPGRFPMMEMLDMAGVVDTELGENVAGPASAAVLDLSETYLSKELAGVKLLNITVLPNPIIITKEEYTDLDDLKNLRIRHPGPTHAKTLEALGAVPTFVPSTEMSEAIARGNIDGILTGYTGIRSFKLLDSAKYVLELASGGMTFAVVMNQDAYDKMPDDLKAAFDKHFGPEGQQFWGRVLARGEIEAREELVEQGLVIRGLSAEDSEKFSEISQHLREETAAELDAKGLNASKFLTDLEATAATYR
ncbi:TRAP transporter substrate-binding protein [Celeribacter neptunius]|uniref:TRAP-type C4-dicarboxylate transport system, substrate-binding protein n=1 Tax=Celeribacter neptunius TaxID=588602 RepID=A0A1I3XWE3_9RHOB|nr:TRAP transporter substrate-binding protein [Celeribacter neptunius]SFK23832.1 TRAP-type C4-dicarboxylate transport system, substrate-binding protein [Celeribacter neptunius]